MHISSKPALLVFATLIIVTGATWAKPVWGVWWTWDAKLTTTLILWFIYVGYLMLRSYSPEGSQGARYGAVVALMGAIDAPIIYLSTIWWRGAHPENNVPQDLDGLHAYCEEFAPFRTELERWFGPSEEGRVFRRGKHKGRVLNDVATETPDYLRWMLGVADMDEDVLSVVREAVAASSPPELPISDPSNGSGSS